MLREPESIADGARFLSGEIADRHLRYAFGKLFAEDDAGESADGSSRSPMCCPDKDDEAESGGSSRSPMCCPDRDDDAESDGSSRSPMCCPDKDDEAESDGSSRSPMCCPQDSGTEY